MISARSYQICPKKAYTDQWWGFSVPLKKLSLRFTKYGDFVASATLNPTTTVERAEDRNNHTNLGQSRRPPTPGEVPEAHVLGARAGYKQTGRGKPQPPRHPATSGVQPPRAILSSSACSVYMSFRVFNRKTIKQVTTEFIHEL